MARGLTNQLIHDASDATSNARRKSATPAIGTLKRQSQHEGEMGVASTHTSSTIRKIRNCQSPKISISIFEY
jgi:hypothetical protein